MDRVSQRSTAVDNRQAMLNSVINETIPSINQSLAQVYNSNNARTIQENDKAATDKFDVLRGMAEAKGAAVAGAADAGVGGVSFANILSDFETRESLAKGSIDLNAKSKMQQIADENLAQKNKAQGAINSAINSAITSTPVPGVGSMIFGAGADIAKGGLSIADRAGVFDKTTKVDTTTGRTYSANARTGG